MTVGDVVHTSEHCGTPASGAPQAEAARRASAGVSVRDAPAREAEPPPALKLAAELARDHFARRSELRCQLLMRHLHLARSGREADEPVRKPDVDLAERNVVDDPETNP